MVSRLKEYIKDFHNYLTEIKFNYNKNDVSKVGRGKYSFTVDDNSYMFLVSPITMRDGRRGFTIEWGLLTAKGLSTIIVGDRKSKIGVFRNVLACIEKFISDEKPEVFSMYVSDKLVHIYDAMWVGHYKDKPFNQYVKDEEKHRTLNGENIYVHYFTKKLDKDISEKDKYIIMGKLWFERRSSDTCQLEEY